MNYQLFNLKDESLKDFVVEDDKYTKVNFIKMESDTRSPGDCRDGTIYVYDDDIILTINIALAARRPLLVRGLTGCGKSSLAYNVARVLNRRYYELVVSSRTKAKDIKWYYDAVRRLSDTQIRDDKDRERVNDISNYIIPGVLWWAFDRDRAIQVAGNESEEPLHWEPKDENGKRDEEAMKRGAVILIDEIDKADPDVPNNLLVPMGSYQFKVEEIDFSDNVKLKNSSDENVPIIIITTNKERTLPDAFLRRCIILDIKLPKEEQLLTIARTHFKDEDGKHDETFKMVYETIKRANNGVISTAEYLDTVKTYLKFCENNPEELVNAVMGDIIGKTTGKES